QPRACGPGAGRFLLRYQQDQADYRLGAQDWTRGGCLEDGGVLSQAQGALLVTAMRVPFLDLARQDRQLKKEIDRAVWRVLRSARSILGDDLTAFELEFAAHCGAHHAVGVGSGTDALPLALRACGVGPGDRVITAPNTAAPTICAIASTGARPVLID